MPRAATVSGSVAVSNWSEKRNGGGPKASMKSLPRSPRVRSLGLSQSKAARTATSRRPRLLSGFTVHIRERSSDVPSHELQQGSQDDVPRLVCAVIRGFGEEDLAFH